MMIESLLGMARQLSPRQDDDAADRLNYLYTPNILLAFAVLISFKQFGGRPMECMLQKSLPGSWEQYAENFCFAQDTYYVAFNEKQIPEQAADRYTRKREISYYKWVPFFLLLQAALFRLPSIFWRYLSLSSGIRLHEIIERAMDPSNLEEPNKARSIEVLSRHLQNGLRFHRRILNRNIEVHKKLKCLNIPYTAFFISVMYLITKTLYLLNAVLQLYMLNRFLRMGEENWYGLKVIEGLFHGVEWFDSGVFPRVAYCDFVVRSAMQMQPYTVQCILVINMFNEKIFVFLWFWYALLIVCTVLSLTYWFITMTVPCFNRWFISQTLELSERKFDPQTRANEVEKFVSTYLRHDGVFVLRMVTTHAGVIFGTDLVLALWNTFSEIEDQLQQQKHENKCEKFCGKFIGACFPWRRKKERNGKDLQLSLEPTTALLPEKSEKIKEAISE